ncbi:ERCC4 domain protein [Methanohalobium evestigatum Z-7303]|uniref:ERCC4 domain protein n=1 Tax=Methanohalobium evestigatum (strain ATCC BAA-1072 / DSM 3721 / NBRC 107634 / OCM 161 / Z-7303) TaxID=644295 RepID=D7EB38_METEZ|nr:DEAD/DEAH box helicase [Methanohalobium evestigatum]ADI74555.1 ERCC4 domain protein [Methanohalobium evestigatum Z-7303]
MADYIKHPLIKENTVEQRLYQLNLAGTSLNTSSLVVLPTGLGKTTVALLVIASRLEKFGGRALVLSPTKPLVEQHAHFLKSTLAIPENNIQAFTGNTSPEKRAELWENSSVIVSTPQVIENDLLAKRIDLNDVSHITFDEAHRAVGNYSYTYIAEKYYENGKNPLCLGITASPGSDDEKINEVCECLQIQSVAVKTETDSDVSPYIQKKQIDWKYVKLPDEIKKLKQLLEKILDDRFAKLSDTGYTVPKKKKATKKDLLSLQSRLHAQLRNDPDPNIYNALSLLAEILKVNHALEVLETQGVDALTKYYDRLDREAGLKSGSKASKRLAEDPYMQQISHRLKECSSEHPKLEMTREIVSKQLEENPDSRAIVFTNYRDTAEMLANLLSEMDGVYPIRFVGQSSKYNDKGLTQKQQVEIIDKFKTGEYNVIVSTSVAEEGLDIPSTDLVLFYEPVPSEIRSIQRKGRTARKQEGRVVVLVTKETRDEAYYWSSVSKERKMQDNMKYLQDIMSQNNENTSGSGKSENNQKKLFDFESETNVDTGQPPDFLNVLVDQRETKSTVVRSLEKLDVDFTIKTLEIADYIVSDRIAIERKSSVDFVNSLIDKTLFEQVSNLSRMYKKPCLILEGDGMFSARQINPNAVYGTLISLELDFGVSIYYTRDEKDTASVIRLLAKREQKDENRDVSMHGKKSAPLLSEQQEYVVSAISDIGPRAARSLLKYFGSVENIMKANYEELQEAELIGPKTASKIREIVGSKYKS